MPAQPDDSPCKVHVVDKSDAEDSDDDEKPSNVFQTFDPFGEAANKSFDYNSGANTTFDIFGDKPASVSVGGAGAGSGPPPGIAAPAAADGFPPGIPAPAVGAWQGYPGAYGMPGFMPMYYGAGHPPGMAMPTGAAPSGATGREEVDALLLEKAALEAENAALRAHMQLEAERAGAMAAIGMHSAGMAAMQAQAQAQAPKEKKNKKKAVEAGAAVGKVTEDKSAVKEDAPEVIPDHTFHTLMLRSLPSAHGFSRDVLMGLLDKEGFKTKYDFVYTPIDFHTERLMGFAFVNFIDHEEALRAKQHLDGFTNWGLQSKKVCEVRWGDAGMQGVQANIEHYRSSPVMHESVPEQYRPVLLSEGVVQVFPAPTKKVRAPRLRHSGARK